MAKNPKPAAPGALDAVRKRIDQINGQVLRLLSERALLAVAAGKAKQAHGASIYQPGRVQAVLDTVVALNPGPLSAAQVRAIFTEIISACTALEHDLRVAFLGPEHTYSHQAALARFGASVAFVPEASIADVFGALDSGRADLGVVPVENSTEGSVTLTLDLLIDTQFVIVGEILMPVRHVLMSRDGEPGAIRRIVSHQQSLAQCRGYLTANFPRAEIEAVASNALAAQCAAAEPGCAAIASSHAAQAYGLVVIAEGIQDLAQNTTRFLVLGREPVARSGQDKTSLLLAVPDRVGALNRVLALFARNAINISKIESRPMRSRPWEYLFFLDLGGHRNDPRLARALKSLRDKTLFLKVLGSYPEAKSPGA